jgi:dynein heavy chain 1
MWDAGLVRHEAGVRGIIAVAQGELIIVSFLRGLDDNYAELQMELVNYRGRCHLVRGWDQLLEGLDEHIAELASMSASPHMKPFESAATAWEGKLSDARETLEVWMDVQRRWVHLESVFFGAAGMQQQLALDFSRFKGLDGEFIAISHRAQRSPLLLDAVAQPGLHGTLLRLQEQLAQVQRALAEYLEQQREAFARFYFVGAAPHDTHM